MAALGFGCAGSARVVELPRDTRQPVAEPTQPRPNGAERAQDKAPPRKPRNALRNVGSRTVTVSGIVLNRILNCGGMKRPSKPPRPVTGRHFLVRRGDRNTNATPVAEFKSGAEGRFELELPVGSYCVVAVEKRQVKEHRSSGPADASNTEAWRAACLARWSAACDFRWNLTTDLDRVRLMAPQFCRGPCYRGPTPP